MEGNSTSYNSNNIRRSRVGSSMSLSEAKDIVAQIREEFGFTVVQEIRANNKVQFYDINIKLKVKS